jgi:putative protein kinase ArgK-like GTPase of G3E family
MDQVLNKLKEHQIRKKEALLSYLKIAQEQENKLKEDDAQGFLDLMDGRERLLETLQKLDADYEPLRQLFLARNKDNPAAAKTEVGSMEQGIDELIKQIQETDARLKAEGETKLKEYGKQVRDARTTKKRVNSYVNTYMSKDAYFIDAKK